MDGRSSPVSSGELPLCTINTVGRIVVKAACQSWHTPGTRSLSPHHCPGSLVSHISGHSVPVFLWARTPPTQGQTTGKQQGLSVPGAFCGGHPHLRLFCPRLDGGRTVALLSLCPHDLVVVSCDSPSGPKNKKTLYYANCVEQGLLYLLLARRSHVSTAAIKLLRDNEKTV